MLPLGRLGAWALVVCLLSGCVAGGVGSTNDGSASHAPGLAASSPKRFVAAIRGFPRSLATAIDGAGAGSTAGLREVAQLVNSGLTVYDGDGRLIPRLAEQVPSLDNGLWTLLPGGAMQTVWNLNPAAVWHDGAEFTSADVAFTARIAQDRQLTIALDSAFDRVESVDTPDPRTVVVRWKSPFISADTLFADTSGQSIVPVPRHLLESPYLADRASFTAHPFWGEQFVGTGPFRLRELAVDSHLILEANDRYLHGRPKIDEIEVRFIGDFNVLVANVLAGAIDINFGRGLSVEQGIEARDQWRDGRLDTSLESITALFPQFVNPSPPAVADVRLRRAMLHAIDRQQLADSLQAGLSPVAHNPIIPTDPMAQRVEGSIVRYDFDRARSRQILEEMGYVRGADGFWRDQSGQRLNLKIQTTIDDLRQKTMAVIGDLWKEAGVEMEPVIISRQLSSDRQVRSEFASFDFTRQPTDPTRYHSAQAPLLENNYRGSNRTRYKNAEFDALLDQYVVTIPVAERAEVLGRVVHHMTDQLVIIGIVYVVEAALVSNRLQNVGTAKIDSALQTWNAHLWEVR